MRNEPDGAEPQDLADLGRVSNLPTVWTNTLAAALLASSAGALAPPSSLVWLLLLAALSLLYLAGMLLNDLLDADWDQQHHNPAPLPWAWSAASKCDWPLRCCCCWPRPRCWA